MPTSSITISTPIQIFPDVLVDDYLDHIALDYLALLLSTFHGVIKHNPCKAEYLEELFWQALKHRYPGLQIEWSPGNHMPFKDIDIRGKPGTAEGLDESGTPNRLHVPVSVKSGTWDSDGAFLTVSGPRVQKILGARSGTTKDIWDSGGQNLVDHLNGEQKQIVSFSAAKPADASFPGNIVYEVCCLKPNIFKYPDAVEWKVETGRGGAATVTCTLESGVQVSLRPSMSYQIWWKIPAEVVTKLRRISIV